MESEPDLRLSEIIDVIKTLENQQISAPNGALTVTPSPHGAEGFTTQQQPQQSQQQQHTPQLQMLQETTANQANVSITPSTNQIPQTPPDVADLTNATSTSSTKPTPYLKIIEQPAQRAIRFRYLCEGRSAGIPGINSMPEKKTYPTIEIVGYEGEAIIVVSCVTNDAPHKPHPHNLVGKEEDGVKNGICYLTRNGKRIREVFSYLSVQCVKKMDIKKALELRESLKVDPFKTKFNHKDQPSSIDLNVVRLCFQAYIKKGNTFKQLPPVVSSPIYDKKAKSDLVISRLCSCSAKVGGGDEIIMLCEKVTKDDIKIRFFESAEDGSTVWEAFAEFQPTDVHKQFAIAFRAPRYHSTEIKQNAKVYIQLIRPSDGDHSEPLLFEYYPDIGMRTFSRLHRKLKRKQDLEIFQQVLSVDSETTATKYMCPPIELQDNSGDNDEPSEPTCSTEESSKSNPLSSDTINEFEQAAKRTSESETDFDGGTNGSFEHAPDMDIELEVPLIIYPTGTDESTQTSSPLEELLAATQEVDTPQLISATDKIAEWMRSSEFERTDSLNVENGDATSLTPVTAYTNVTNTSSILNATLSTGSDEDDDGFNDLLEQVAELDEALASEATLENSNIKSQSVDDATELEDAIADMPAAGTASTQASVDIDENFDETSTYTSLQIAFKNPIDIPMNVLKEPHLAATTYSNKRYEDEVEDLIVLTNPLAPKIKVNASPTTLSTAPMPPPRTPSPVPEQMLPPLPPKRIRPPAEIALNAEQRSSDPGPATGLQLPGNGNKQRPQSQIIIMRTPEQSPTKRQPKTPPGASPKKKQGFFSRFFARRKSRSEPHQTNSKTPSASSSREPSIGNFSLLDANRASLRSEKSNSSSLHPQSGTPNGSATATKCSKPVARSSSSTSGKRPAYLNADVIHIPLKGGESTSSLSPRLQPPGSAGAYSSCSTITLGNQLDRRTLSALQLADIPISDGNMELVAIADRQSIRNLCEGAFNVQLDPSVDLSEAEHFALYTSIPTGEEVQNMSYYEQVEAGLILTADDVARRLAEANGL